MHEINQTLTGALQSLTQPGTTTRQPISDFTDQERDSTGYFFLRLRNLYGSKYAQQYADEEDVKLAKREWAKQIGQLTRDQIHELFEAVKRIQSTNNPPKVAEKLQWPDIGTILSIAAQGWEHRVHAAKALETDTRDGVRYVRNARGELVLQQALPDMSKRERAIAARNAHIEKLNGMFPQ